MNPLAFLRARRERANSDPYEAAEWLLLREARPEGQALRRRRRRKIRPALLRGEAS